MHIKIQKQGVSKFILDHLEEQIIIFNSDEKIDFMNYKFESSFKNQIFNHNKNKS